MTKEVMQQAMLDEIELVLTDPQSKLSNGAQYALRYVYQQIQAITEAEKQEQGEPWGTYMGHRLTPEGTKEFWGFANAPLTEGTKLYAKPQTKEWVGLTTEEQSEIYNINYNKYAVHLDFADFLMIYTAIDAKLKGKNA